MKRIHLRSPYFFSCLQCLSLASTALLSAYAYGGGSDLRGYIMHVQMTPAVCEFDASSKKQRKCLEGYSLTISSLIPETEDQDCSTRSSATLSPLQAKVVARVMPDENARVQLWKTVGGCVPMNASQYFRTIINYAERLKIPLGLTSANDVEIRQNELRQQFIKLNPALPTSGIHFSCRNSRAESVLTEVQVCYAVNGRYKNCSSEVVTNCGSEMTIRGTY